MNSPNSPQLLYILENSGLLEPRILILLGMALILMLTSSLSSPKSKRTTAQFADRTTKYNLCREAIRQLKNQQVDEVCLYSGSFKNWQIRPAWLWFSIFILGITPTLFVPTANPGVEVIGAPGMGKTYGVINPLNISAIDQGFPVLLYDYKGGGYGGKGGQIPVVAGYAARHGYKIRVFAPGKDYTCTINPLDFIKNSEDTSMAKTLAETLHDNLVSSTGRSDNFFSPAGKRVLYSSFLLAKNTPYPDLAMAFAILQLSDLGKRLIYAREQKNPAFTTWNYIPFSQYMGFSQAKETSEGILGGAQQIASVFIQRDLLPCILGQTNISLDLTGKEMLVLQSDESRRKVYNPLIAAMLEVIVNKNFAYQRDCPLVLSLDEYKTIKISESIHWPNWHRSKGLIMIVGYQNESQVADEYGKNGLSTLRTALKASFLFNPRNEENEAKWSKVLGEKEIIIKNKSRSFGGGKSGKSTTISEQRILEPLIRPDQIRGMRKGAVIYTNPELYKGERGSIPWKIKRVKVSFKDTFTNYRSTQIWLKKSIKVLRQYEQQRRPFIGSELEKELDKRLEYADKELLPLPPEDSDIHTKDLVI